MSPTPRTAARRPQRVQPPVSSQGVLDGLTMAKEDLRSVIGIYDASLGKQGNETSAARRSWPGSVRAMSGRISTSTTSRVLFAAPARSSSI
jgi:hypothetical protein